MAELEPTLNFCRSQVVSLLSLCVTAGRLTVASSGGFALSLLRGPVQNLGRVMLGHSDMCQIKDEKDSQGIPVLYRQTVPKDSMV